jgi:hypothetical protein
MKKVNVLGLVLLTLLGLGLFNFLESPLGKAQARQQPARVRVDVVNPIYGDASLNSVQVSGRIVGFSCVGSDDRPAQCFIASTD